MSANFLVQILNDLRRAGLVTSRRGQAGGYLLARAPQDVTLRQVVEAVDPALLQCSVSWYGKFMHQAEFGTPLTLTYSFRLPSPSKLLIN